MKILVTGANGNICSLIIPKLRSAGVDVRAVVRDAAKAQALRDQGCEVVVHDLDDRDGMEALFSGIDRAFLLTAPNPDAAKQMSHLFDAAKGSDVHIVRMSALKAAADAPTDNGRLHFASDKELKDSGLTYTILRPHFFMQNALMSLETIQKEGKMYWGMGDAKIGMVDIRDIADCATTILVKGGHEGKVYTPTGPETVTWNDVAKASGKAIGTDVSYVPVAVEDVRQSLLGMGEWFADVMADYSRAYADGWGDFTTDDVETITGNEARSIDDFSNEVVAPMIVNA